MPIKYPIRQSTLASKVERYMDEVAKLGSEQAGAFPQRTRQRLYGMEALAMELGISCTCFRSGAALPLVRPARLVCKCRSMTARERTQALSGEHCRDSQGVFVPVPQCTGKLRADITIPTPPAPKRKRKKKRS